MLQKWGRIVKLGGIDKRLLGSALRSQRDGRGARKTVTKDVSKDLLPVVREQTILKPRPPVVTIMGHVDHGKTTLLDWLRKTSVAAGEAGGITQHIGAFSVQLSGGERLTFLDTPGHAAFSAMRARGASLTDLVVLVVAVDDGVMVQTRECVEMIKTAGVPLVVAVNKCDKFGTDPEKVEKELLQCGVQLEKFGGDVQSVHISALTGSGVLQLEEALLAEAELSAVKGDPTGPVEAVVIESHVERGLGPVASLVVQHGTLQCGHVLVAGQALVKIRAMFDERRQPMRTATPSTPVMTIGWRELPNAGDHCLQVDNEAVARSVINYRTSNTIISHHVKNRKKKKKKEVVEEVQKEEEGGRVGVVVKGDVAGRVEVLLDVLKKKQPEGIAIRVVHSGVGPVTESDVEMASTSSSIILAFGVTSSKTVIGLAKEKKVTIYSHNVIYKLLQLLKDQVERLLPWQEQEEIVGEAVVIKTFKLTGAKAAVVGGCRVKTGRLLRSSTYRLLRDGEVVHEGPISGMKQGRNDVTEAKKETECGISFASDSVQWREGDRVIAFNKHSIPPSINWDFGF